MSLLRASVLGGVDGVITSFAVVAGADAGGLATRVALVIGASSVLADGLSMGVSEFLSSSAEAAAEQRRARDDAPGRAPVVLGLACFGAFVACGALPLAVYLVGSMLTCVAFALLELCVLGAVRARASGEPLLLGIVQTTGLGSLAGGLAYGVARALEGYEP
jgi:VIT1/CCC1 family predicted Fe2+/Mn2+ transporter